MPVVTNVKVHVHTPVNKFCNQKVHSILVSNIVTAHQLIQTRKPNLRNLASTFIKIEH
jgi:hypothetical protein